ncbi:MAG: hypothetical protein GX982_06360 [Tissierellia bacterium]|nr:hypothetical protein [Tissierellia bacterium]
MANKENNLKKKWWFWPLTAIIIALVFVGINNYYYDKKDDKLMDNSQGIRDELNSELEGKEKVKIDSFSDFSDIVKDILTKDENYYKKDYEMSEDFYSEKIDLSEAEKIDSDLRDFYKNSYLSLESLEFGDKLSSKEMEDFKSITDNLKTGFVYRIYGLDEKMESFKTKGTSSNRAEKDKITKYYQEANSKIRDGRNLFNRLEEKNR